jgi:hypothetical protein
MILLTSFLEGLQLAASTGWLKAPATVDGVSDVIPSGGSTCDQNPGNAIGPYQTQLGSGTDDGAYAHTGVLVAGLNGFSNPASVGFNNTLPQGVYWADINGDGGKLTHPLFSFLRNIGRFRDRFRALETLNVTYRILFWFEESLLTFMS